MRERVPLLSRADHQALFPAAAGNCRQVRIAGGHIAFRFNDAGRRRPFCSSVNMP